MSPRKGYHKGYWSADEAELLAYEPPGVGLPERRAGEAYAGESTTLGATRRYS